MSSLYLMVFGGVYIIIAIVLQAGEADGWKIRFGFEFLEELGAWYDQKKDTVIC